MCLEKNSIISKYAPLQNDSAPEDFFKKVKAIVKKAGESILDIHYSLLANEKLDISYKDDMSPITKADTLSNMIICNALTQLTPSIPIVSEEQDLINPSHLTNLFWLVDPLDGTKEFIGGSKEFTVNVALINEGIPIFGVVYAPALDKFYWNEFDNAYVVSNNVTHPIHTLKSYEDRKELTILVSKSHMDDASKSFIDKLRSSKIMYMGSSIKICLIAEGFADIYVRFFPTYEWDTAAAHAILLASGGDIHHEDYTNLCYNKPKYLNSNMIVKSKALKVENFLISIG
jgi:3'(2'), 5'-bisphosphate nucleotidase